MRISDWSSDVCSSDLFDLNSVAALLTIVGYSLNDTIVVYDRIRENLKKYRKMDIVPLLNLSINETLSRTVMTSVAMLLALGVLLILDRKSTRLNSSH